MQTLSIFEALKKILVERFAIAADKVQPQADFQNALNLDSLDMFDLWAAVNEVFHVRLSEAVFEKIHTVEDLVVVIAQSVKLNNPL
jgi:acyl carrier protein